MLLPRKKINSEWHFKRRKYNRITNSAYDLTVSCFKECGQLEPNRVEMFKKNGTFYLVVNYTFWIVSACVHVSVWMCKVKWSNSHSVVFDSLWPVDYSLQGSSVNGILQARILQWVAIPFPRGSSQSRDQTQVSCIAGRFFTVWATREANILIVIIWFYYSYCSKIKIDFKRDWKLLPRSSVVRNF